MKLKACPTCASPRPADLRVPCPRCSHVKRNGSHAGWRARRQRVLTRDHGICHICGGLGADSVDHIVALANGGTDTDANTAAAHLLCNKHKAAR